jgi:hypothetical protein
VDQNRCPQLAGQCTETGEHHDHESAPVTIPAPTGLLYADLLHVCLADYGDGPAAVVAVGGDDAQLDARALLVLADALEAVVVPLRRMSSRLAIAEARKLFGEKEVPPAALGSGGVAAGDCRSWAPRGTR